MAKKKKPSPGKAEEVKKPTSRTSSSAKKSTESSAKKPAAKKATSDSKAKPAAKATTPKTSAAKKTATKAASSAKSPAKKAAQAKAEAPKAAAPKAAAKKATPAKAAEKKAPAKKAAPKKAAAHKKAAPAKKSAPKTAAKKSAAPTKLAASGSEPRLRKEVSPMALREIEEDERELPLEYGDTKIVAMVRDPEWLFAYWEINNDVRENRGLARGSHERLLALRVYELATAEQEVSEKFFDVPVNDYTSSWYVRIPTNAEHYRVSLGVFEDGRFESIALSNVVSIPRRQIAEESDVEFAEINDEIFSQIVQLSGGLHIRERLGSDEFLKSLQQRVFQSLTEGPLSSGAVASGGLSSSSLFGGLSSGAMYGLSSAIPSSWLLSSSSMLGGASNYMVEREQETVTHRRADKQRGFWLEVGVDVIVYGATEPDAKVKFMGREIQLTPDGTFRFRMVLPDTEIQFPIEAVSGDGEEKREVMPVVKRHTEGDPHKPV